VQKKLFLQRNFRTGGGHSYIKMILWGAVILFLVVIITPLLFRQSGNKGMTKKPIPEKGSIVKGMPRSEPVALEKNLPEESAADPTRQQPGVKVASIPEFKSFPETPTVGGKSPEGEGAAHKVQKKMDASSKNPSGDAPLAPLLPGQPSKAGQTNQTGQASPASQGSQAGQGNQGAQGGQGLQGGQTSQPGQAGQPGQATQAKSAGQANQHNTASQSTGHNPPGATNPPNQANFANLIGSTGLPKENDSAAKEKSPTTAQKPGVATSVSTGAKNKDAPSGVSAAKPSKTGATGSDASSSASAAATGNKKTASGGKRMFTVQVGSFKDKQNAEELQQSLQKRGYNVVMKSSVNPKYGQLYVVQLTPVAEVSKASTMLEQIKNEEKVKPFIIQVPTGQ